MEWAKNIYVNGLNRASGDLKVHSGVMVCHWTLHFWHCIHALSQLRMSMCTLMPGQTYRVVISHCVARIPGWDSECSELKTARRIFVGTKGRGTPVEVSLTIVDSDRDNGISLRNREEGEERRLWS